MSIASYRDSELVPTLRDAIAKANRPDRLRFGICWQHGPDEDLAEFAKDPRISVLDVDWRASRGACWARAECMRMYDGEDYFLQLDSHHRFTADWDEKVLHQLRSCPADKPVLSAYLPVYEVGQEPDPRAEPLLFLPRAIGADSIPNVLPVPIPGWADRDRPVRARFVSGHFLLAAGAFVGEVPYDPDLYFHGEEITMSVRAFTHGWDLFHPVRTTMWHNYGGFYRRKHWDDHSLDVGTPWDKRDRFSRMTARTLLLTNPVGPLRCGTARTVADYEAYAGIDFRARTMTSQAEHGVEPPTMAQV